MISLNDATFVAGQVTIDDLADAAAANVKLVVNHRTPHEEPGQPSTAEMTEMAARFGLRYVEIPVAGAPDQAAAQLTLEAMNSLAPGERVLLYCRSGMRSSAAWAMAERLRGAAPDDLRARALAAGYDLSRLPL
ncbi:Beta-lactamase hydrolase-like protein [compost metagenome]